MSDLRWNALKFGVAIPFCIVLGLLLQRYIFDEWGSSAIAAGLTLLALEYADYRRELHRSRRHAPQ